MKHLLKTLRAKRKMVSRSAVKQKWPAMSPSYIKKCYCITVWAKKVPKQEYEKSKKKLSHILEKQESLLKGTCIILLFKSTKDITTSCYCCSVPVFTAESFRVFHC